jgi:hypothetical protein
MNNKKNNLWLLMVCLIILNAGCAHRTEYRQITVREYLDKMKGGWIGQMAGVGWGAPTEFKWTGEIIPADSVPAWTPKMTNQFGQDDIYVEMTFLRTLELYGLDVDIRQAGIDFADSRYMLWHANKAGRDNLRSGIAPPWSGHPKYNSHADDIDYQIEADYAGLISPGLQQSAVDLGEIFGRLMNYGDGLYGGQFVAGMIAEAFFESDIEKVIQAGLSCVPEKSLYAETIRDVIEWAHQYPDDWETVWYKIEHKYNDNPEYRKFSCAGPGSDFNIDAKINGAYIVMGLLYGRGDPDKTIAISMRCGQDSDCNPSSAAGVLGTILGASHLPVTYTSALDAHQRFSYTDYDFTSLIAVCKKLARQNVLRYGGRIEVNAEGDSVFVVPVRNPGTGALEYCWEPGPLPEDVKFTDAEMARITLKVRPRDAFINRWLVAGPYMQKDTEGSDLFDVVFPPEIKDPGVIWNPYPVEKTGQGAVALDKLFGTSQCAAYLMTRIWCPETRKSVIEAGSDDGIKLWINGKLVHANNIMRGYTEGEDTVSVELQKGWNDFMAKITQGTGGWQAGFVITDEQGQVMKDLEYKAEN